jgi:hypothetical protein
MIRFRRNPPLGKLGNALNSDSHLQAIALNSGSRIVQEAA